MHPSELPRHVYRTQVRYRTCHFVIQIHYYDCGRWTVEAGCSTEDPVFGSWTCALSTKSPALVLDCVLKEIPKYNSDQLHPFLRPPVDEMHSTLRADPLFAKAFEDWDAFGAC